MSKAFDRLTEDEQRFLDETYRERVMGDEGKIVAQIGDKVEVLFVGKIVAIEQDVFKKDRVLIKIRNDDGDTVTVFEGLVRHRGKA